jgi:sulfur carrier protein
VQGLLETLGITGKRIAVAVNRDVVPRSTFETHRLAPGDRIEILEAVGGG